ncbi:MAG: helix-turn-helix domain-containing protein [Bacteroidota bacterium]
MRFPLPANRLVPDRLRLILGVKLRALRHERGLGLKDVARSAGLSVSYLSEIEQGKKYPKPDKLIDLAHALGVPYDDLVSLRVDKGLGAVKDAIESPLLQSFPFKLFGLDPKAVVGMLSGATDKADALVRALTDLTRAYDARVEDVLQAAMRAYQQVHANHLPDLEALADRLRLDVAPDGPLDAAALRAALESRGVTVETGRLGADPDLATFRSVLTDGDPPTLHVNSTLAEHQRAFVYARELAFVDLAPEHRPRTSPWTRVERFEEVFSYFEASYVAGAMLLPAAEVDAALAELAAETDWAPGLLTGMLERFRATPEMVLHRLTQRIPEALGLSELYFLRFHHDTATDRVTLTKSFNLSPVPVPHGIAADEHWCRRWPGLRALADLDRAQARAAGRGGPDPPPTVVAQRQRFAHGTAAQADGEEFFTIAMARPLALRPGVNSAVSLGLLLSPPTKQRVRVWDAPALDRVEVSLTCERCPVDGCRVRAAPARVLARREARDRKERAVAALATRNPR